MLYVQRDSQGYFVRVQRDAFEGMTEKLAIDTDELQAWLRAKKDVRDRLTSLDTSDLELVRVVEDVVIVLVEQGVIEYTDLPEAARFKLDQRALARAEIEGLCSLASEAE